MAIPSFRDVVMSALIMLFIGLLCLGFPLSAHAKYNDLSMFRTYFGCPPCDKSQCPTPVGCAELAEAPGVCSCCMTCARQEGDSCGVSTEKCGMGLRCNPPEHTMKGFEMLMEGKGMCEPIEAFPGFPAMARRSQWMKRNQIDDSLGYP